MDAAKFWRSSLQSTLDLFLQKDCLLCNRSSSHILCPTCQTQLQDGRRRRPLDRMGMPVFAWGDYEGALKRSILGLKYDGAPAVGEYLGQWLGEAWQQAGLPNLTVVSIPMHEEKRRQRGYNQAEVIAQSFARRANLKIDSRLLGRSRETTAQFGLNLAKRRDNLRSAFTANPPSQQSVQGPTPRILLVDDIYTTGATARSAKETLEAVGFRVWGIAVVAR
jgi:ComF family protein